MTTTIGEALAHKSAEKSERHVRASSAVKKRKMLDSPALLASVDARRLRKAVVVTGVSEAVAIRVIQPEEFGKLNIDERYQRVRVSGEVNQMISALKAGGTIPDPIDVAERKDGSWWIIDGQQRFWAHSEVVAPLKALIHKVEDLDAEKRLFIALNSRVKLATRTIIKGWPGLAGTFIRKMNESETSPVRGMIDLTHNSKLPLDAPALVKGVLIATTGVMAHGDMATVVLPRLDAALRVPGGPVWAENFVQLVAAVFGMKSNAGRVRVLPILALAHVAHRRFKAAGRQIFPKSCARLRAVNWDTAVPSHAAQYLPLLEQRIEKLWK